MKCPKCSYLGFETGDRCRNCGYDFSLATATGSAPMDLPLHEAGTLDPAPPVDAMMAPARPRLVETSLPLFNPDGGDDDTPLITLPAAPRAPLAVRRTPDMRLRPVPRAVRRAATDPPNVDAEPVLAFTEEEPVRPARTTAAPRHELTGPSRRVTAAAIDHVILLGIDAVVVYFTLRLAEVSIGDLPLVPMLGFLAMLKAAYFYVFTLVGGQTIGKMAAHIRVIAEDNRGIDPARAITRTLAGALSFVTLGLAFLPALIAPDRRAFHDRVARTRVVAQS